MVLRLCQLKSRSLLILSALLLTSCSWRKADQKNTVELLTTFPNDWFKRNPEHSLIGGPQSAPLSHLLIDITPEFNASEQLVNVVVATPEGSAHSYNIDLLSGQRYYNHSYCKQNDVWDAYSGTVNRPSFAVAHVPRVLDQLGDPQKVIVWSTRESFQRTAISNYHQVKLIGAYVEQICPEGNCIGKTNWLSKLVFIGIDAEDKNLLAKSSLDVFKKTIDWEKAKAMLENIEGRNFIGENTYPAVKVGPVFPFTEALEFFKKRSIFLTDQELLKIQKSCQGLYDKLWTEVGIERPEDRPATTKEQSEAKHKLITRLKKEKKLAGFAERLKSFTRKYSSEFSTCEKFVYHGNFNHNPEKFWFLAFMDIYYRLHKEGYFFDCRTKTWQRNILNDQGEPIHDLKRDIVLCSEKEFDQAMNYLPNFLTGLKGEREYFKFIDYDTHSFGTHRKLYTWVKIKSLRFDCRKDPNVEIRKQIKIFPEEVSWKERYSVDYAEKEKIIR